ncbi:MAG: very short patch repair endonuclease [Acetobacteraceae bacterium]|nr:very short patch repair endonuclease [Acetobacteraceae bacterium]
MVDRLTPEARSRNMAAIRGKDTAPELAVRRMLHAMGYRFRLHRSDLPGSPDIVLPRHGKAVFVHGCFWHQHKGCVHAPRPASRASYWLPKLAANVARDERTQRELRRLGWGVIVVWECQVRRDAGAVARRLQRLLPSG